MGALLRLALAALVLAMGCAGQTPPGPFPASATDACASFCALAAKMSCDQAKPGPGPDEIAGTADDIPCAQVCATLVVHAKLDPDLDCLDRNGVTSCDDMEACLMGTKPLAPRGTP